MSEVLPGIAIGHWENPEGVTGCTVLLPTAGAMRAGVHVGGGAPGTRETDLLAPGASVSEIHALLFSGGSAFGLDAASGVVRYLREQGRGFDVGVARVPIVPAAVIFDLGIGEATAYPDNEAGYRACLVARPDDDREGTVGAGYGARVGQILGAERCMKGGMGLASNDPASPIRLGVLAVVNAAGDIIDAQGQIIAGAQHDGAFLDSTARLSTQLSQGAGASQPLRHTTLVAVATNARLDKLELTMLAKRAHDGLALAISPTHTAYDGDAVFALSTGELEAAPVALTTLAVRLVAEAIRRAVRAATGLPGALAWRDLPHRS